MLPRRRRSALSYRPHGGTTGLARIATEGGGGGGGFSWSRQAGLARQAGPSRPPPPACRLLAHCGRRGRYGRRGHCGRQLPRGTRRVCFRHRIETLLMAPREGRADADKIPCAHLYQKPPRKCNSCASARLGSPRKTGGNHKKGKNAPGENRRKPARGLPGKEPRAGRVSTGVRNPDQSGRSC